MAGVLDLGFDDTSSVASTVDSHFRGNIRKNHWLPPKRSSSFDSQSSNLRKSRYSFDIHVKSEEDVVVNGHETYSWFFMNLKGEIEKDVTLPKVVKSIEQLNEMLPKELDNQYELNILCNDYTSVVKAKWNCFMSHVEELKHVLNDIDIPIVGFTGLFVQIMTTPLKLKDWCARVWKLDDVIYMRSAKEKDLPNNLSEANNALLNFHRFLKLSQEEEDKVLYEKEKFFKVSSVQINEHHLFTMNEVNAVEEDEDGRLSEIKISFKTLGNCQNFYRNKFFTLWSHALLSGQKNIFFGTKGKDMKLQRIFSMSTNTEAMVKEMQQENGSLAWNPDDILNFLYRFLTFVKMVMKDERVTNGRVVSFIYKKGQKKLGSYKKGFDHIYPKFENYDYKHVPDWDLIAE